MQEDGKEHPVERTAAGALGRRSFLQAGGLSLAAAALSGCQKPFEKAIPYLIQPEEIVPGVANWYASTCGGCPASCGILARTREGRPVKLEGNDLDTRTGGGLCAVGQATVWSLYDSERLKGPVAGGKAVSWDEADKLIWEKLLELDRAGKEIRLLTGTIVSPAASRAVETFLSSFSKARHVSYDPVSASAIREAYRITHGRAMLPSYRFDRAALIVSFDADFLGTWLSPVEFTHQYTSGRRLGDGNTAMSRHVQLESRLSLTGANADQRICIATSDQFPALLRLAGQLARLAGAESDSQLFPDEAGPADDRLRGTLAELAGQLWAARGKSLVACGSNETRVQLLAAYINHLLGGEGNTLDLERPSACRQGDEAGLAGFIEDMNAGKVGALIVWGVNPAYSYPEVELFTDAMKRVELTVSLNGWKDETAELADCLCPDHHYLEAWGDSEPSPGCYTLRQPAIRPLFDTRHAVESLLAWTGRKVEAYDYLRDFWREQVFPKQSEFPDFEKFWESVLRNGVCRVSGETAAGIAPAGFSREAFSQALQSCLDSGISATEADSGIQLDLYQPVSMQDGSCANIPWLQELPDPISKVTWDNVALLAPSTASGLGLRDGDIVRVSRGTVQIELPVALQPGQHERVVSIALGYGRTRAGRAGSVVGVNAYRLVELDQGTFRYSGARVLLEPAGGRVELARTQTHDRLENRPLVWDLSLNSYLEHHAGQQRDKVHQKITLWEAHEHKEHRWAMGLDLNLCTGCAACVIACQAENNIPTVGRQEVQRRREMHWLRIDRYYTGPEEEPSVLFQPIMCSQCDNAPCETVCPTLAAVHSSDGLNMQVYNRCIGTRYCENNCPFKVRRFNWFNYNKTREFENLVLNPDVTVRSRGVMEKCTFCVQRIQEKKILARNERRPVADGEIRPACAQSCPAGAIVFGDLKDPESRISRLFKDSRHFRLLTELNIEPAVAYLSKVRNKA